MYGSLTTKEIKKKHSSRPVGGTQTGSQSERTHSKAVAGRPSEMAECGTGQARLQLADPTRWWLVDHVAPHSCIDWEQWQGNKADHAAQGSSVGE